MTKYYPSPQGRKYVFKNVNLDILEPSNIGVLGLNGSGKSTLIRLLSGSEYPNEGRVKVDGYVSWPLGLGGAILSSLTGRENAKFVCTLYGSSKREALEKVEFVKEFSELGDFFELPVKTYSSGMRSKLNFAMSMAFNFTVYLIDELMSVGDARFREKSMKALQDIRHRASYIMVSHNINALTEQCDSLVLLINGELTAYEDVKLGLQTYRDFVAQIKK